MHTLHPTPPPNQNPNTQGGVGAVADRPGRLRPGLRLHAFLSPGLPRHCRVAGAGGWGGRGGEGGWLTGSFLAWEWVGGFPACLPAPASAACLPACSCPHYLGTTFPPPSCQEQYTQFTPHVMTRACSRWLPKPDCDRRWALCCAWPLRCAWPLCCAWPLRYAMQGHGGVRRAVGNAFGPAHSLEGSRWGLAVENREA